MAKLLQRQTRRLVQTGFLAGMLIGVLTLGAFGFAPPAIDGLVPTAEASSR